MASNSVHVVRNTANFRCENCQHVHEYISGASDRSGCATPIGFSYERGIEVAESLGLPDDAVMEAPNLELVRLDESARKLPRGAAAELPGLHREVISPIR